MGRMILILVIGGGLLFAVTTLNMNRSNSSMSNNSVQSYQVKEAKNYAQSGIEFATKYLADDSTWAGTTKQLNNGSLIITAQNTSSQYYNGPNVGLTSARLVTSVGIYGTEKDTVRAVVQLQNSNMPNLPKFMNYASASGNNIVLSGNDQIVDDNNSAWNSNCQANGDFYMGGWDLIKGFVTYNGEVEADKKWSLNSNISPNQNPNNLPAYSQTSKVSIPTFNPDNYKSQATTVYNGSQTISGNLILGSKTNPQIIYVGGDLNLSGNITGYGVFIVKGNINIKGNVTINSQDPSSSNLGLYSSGDLTTNGGVVINAQIFTGGNANLNSNCSVHGSVTSVGSINLSTNVNIYYRPANSYLTSPFWVGDINTSTTTRPVVVSYFE